MGCVGFWLWALVGAGMVFGMISFIVFFLIPPAVLVAFLMRSRWNNGPVLLGIVAGAGVPLLVVAGLNWSDWNQRTIGDNTPNPYYWGAAGLCLLAAGTAAYVVGSRRS